MGKMKCTEYIQNILDITIKKNENMKDRSSHCSETFLQGGLNKAEHSQEEICLSSRFQILIKQKQLNVDNTNQKAKHNY